jgi:Na+-transporting methylmalonyl-CoA/oxaloacetate decarboxylase gamma subunit
VIPGWVRVFAVLALVGALVWGVNAWEGRIYQQGYAAAKAEADAREKQIQSEEKDKLASATADALTKEREIRRAFDAMSASRMKKESDYETTIASLRADARSGALRLSIAIDAGSLPGCAPAADPAAAGAPDRETRADVLPGTADDVLRIASGTARGVRDYNELVDRYNEARRFCNEQPIGALP